MSNTLLTPYQRGLLDPPLIELTELTAHLETMAVVTA
jgi:hypothetical protein